MELASAARAMQWFLIGRNLDRTGLTLDLSSGESSDPLQVPGGSSGATFA
jgi:hypothetical protein